MNVVKGIVENKNFTLFMLCVLRIPSAVGENCPYAPNALLRLSGHLC
jgi:hypothetical protein